MKKTIVKGTGVPIVLMSLKLAVNEIEKDYKSL